MGITIVGLDVVETTLAQTLEYWEIQRDRAAAEIAQFLEQYAKTHHNTTPRKAAYVYPSPGVRRFRPAGIGWGDITGRTQQTTYGRITDRAATFVTVALSAGMDYDVFLELLHQGRWAWIWNAVADGRDVIMGIIRKYMTLP